MRKVIGGRVVKFDNENHIYKVDGVIVPNGTTILNETIFKGKYKNVPRHILENASRFGRQIHNAIERKDDTFLSDLQKLKYNEFWQLVKDNDIEIVEQELIVYYVCEETGKVLFIGTLDLIILFNGLEDLSDIKTTYNLDIQNLSWQLGFYKIAYEQLFNKQLNNGSAFWLPKRKSGGLYDIEMKTKDEVLELVKEYGEVI